jgi:hypothetical protein
VPLAEPLANGVSPVGLMQHRVAEPCMEEWKQDDWRVLHLGLDMSNVGDMAKTWEMSWRHSSTTSPWEGARRACSIMAGRITLASTLGSQAIWLCACRLRTSCAAGSVCQEEVKKLGLCTCKDRADARSTVQKDFTKPNDSTIMTIDVCLFPCQN